MKKLVAYLLILVTVLPFAGCKSQESVDNQSGCYVYQDSDDVMKPQVVLLEDNRCEFTFSSISSYFGVGTYTINGDALVINTDDGKYKYTFGITYKSDGKTIDTLTFDADDSSDNIHFGDFADGAVFAYDRTIEVG